MAVTLGDLKTTILNEAYRDSAQFGSFVQNSILTAIKFMEGEHPYIYAKTGNIIISSGQNSTLLPNDFNCLVYVNYNIGNVVYGRYQGFTEENYSDLQDLFNNTLTTGRPSKYALFANQFFVYPYTSDNFQFNLSYYYKDSVYPSLDTDTSIWFNDFTYDAVRAKATEDFYTFALQSPDLGAQYGQRYDLFIQNIAKKQNKRTVTNLLSI